jgi:hypothetical protein
MLRCGTFIQAYPSVQARCLLQRKQSVKADDRDSSTAHGSLEIRPALCAIFHVPGWPYLSFISNRKSAWG